MGRLHALGATLTLLLALSTEVPAAASDEIVTPVPAGFTSWEELFAEQGRLNDALAAIRRTADQVGDRGYGSAIADPTAHALTLYWAGEIFPAVRQAIEAQRDIVPINVYAAQYSEDELVAEVQRLGKIAAFHVVAPKPDASGITIEWAAGRVDPGAKAHALTTSPIALTFGAESAASSSVPLSRQDDGTPYKGGARTRTCTAGFAVNHTSGTKLLFAGHCGSNGTTVVDGGDDVMGPMAGDNDTRDVAYISVLSAGEMWDGGPQSTLFKPVQDATNSVIGNNTCTSGSRSGVRCGVIVKAVNTSISGKTPLVMGEQIDHTNAAGQGDSGGPVFELGTVAGKVRAKGIISTGATNAPATCTGETVDRSCFWRIYWADVNQTMAYYGGMGIRVS